MSKDTTFANKVISNIRKKNSKYWIKKSQVSSIQLFHKMASDVPAYKNFLKLHKINPKSIKTNSDLQLIPETTKNNYLRKYGLEELSWNGVLTTPTVLTSTSGSAGPPVYFSRGHQLNLQSSIIHELYFENQGFKRNEPTLVIDAFGMGVWIGGLITFQAFELLRERGCSLSIITPGINKEEILKILRDVAPNFKQIILAGYPPFLKDIIDEAPRHNIKLHKHNIRLLFAAEPFTDKFREYVAKKAGIKSEYLDTMNIYGTADLGTIAFETPLSIFIRKTVSHKPRLFCDVFPAVTKTPTLAQYVPTFTNFDVSEENLLITGDNSLPLMRYSLGDHGGIIQFEEMEALFHSHKINLRREVKKLKLDPYYYKLPFVYVYERSDFSTTLYGLQIYPEPIREVLLARPYDALLTGKFSLITKFDSRQNQYLEINLEVQREKKVSKSVEKKLVLDITNKLRKSSSEFRELSDYLNGKSKPVLLFWPSEDPLYFKPGVKQKWVMK